MIARDNASSRRTSIVLAIVLALLQLSVVPNVGLLGGRANLALVFVACACLGADPTKAPAIGFAAGLFYDFAGSGPIGLMTVVLTSTAWLLAASGRVAVADDLPGALVAFIPAAFGVALAYAVVLLATGVSGSFVDAVFARALPGAALDCVCFWVVGFVLSRGPGSSGRTSASRRARPSKGSYRLKRGL